MPKFYKKGVQHFSGKLTDKRVVIICEQIDGNPGMSITNAVEYIAFQVCEQFDIDPRNLVWIEHYDPGLLPEEEWNLVTFDKVPPNNFFIGPKWRPLTESDWRSIGFRPKKISKTSKEHGSRFQWY